MSIVVDASVAVILEQLAQSLISLSEELRNYAQTHKHVDEEITRWKRMFRHLRAVLRDAEEKQSSEPSVREWLEDLQCLTYKAEDCYEDLEYEILNRLMKCQHRAGLRKVTNLIPRALIYIKIRRKIVSRFQKITVELEEIMKQKQRLRLVENDSPTGSRSYRSYRRPPAGSAHIEQEILGRDNDREDILRWLLNDGAGEPIPGVITIVGMGGLGKTTLARYVFNDAVCESFQVRAWVCVSNDYDILRISKGILESISHRACDFTELSMIQRKIEEILKGKRFLIVFDDIWNPKHSDWKTLRAPLLNGARGSKIIVTTRLVAVADTMGTTKNVQLKKMEDGDCWRLFCVHADIDRNGNSALEEIGRKIAMKCGGLPLAATVLGGFLRRKEREEDWKAVLYNKSWGSQSRRELEDEELLAVLRLSYDDLTFDLKKCFAFCAVFPEDYNFKENDLVLLWLGAGLIGWDKSTHQEEDETTHRESVAVGHAYFRDLVSRSMFLPSSGYKFRYVMHDAVRRVALEVAGKSCYAWEATHPLTERRQQVDWPTTRHLSFLSKSFSGLFPEIMRQNVRPPPLRTFLSLEGSLNCAGLPENALACLFSRLKYLKVLSLRSSNDVMLPKYIDQLSHLRYLDLSRSSVGKHHGTRFLNSLASLFKLEILILVGCQDINELPEKVDNFQRLRYLNMAATSISSLPETITLLTKLETLILCECHQITDLPEKIGSMMSLRHLDLSSTEIRRLPASTTSLINLAYLILRNCKRLSSLPLMMERLVNLRHLDIESTDVVDKGIFPSGISQLNNLCRLSDYVIIPGNTEGLGNLNQLKGKLIISRLENEACTGGAKTAKLRDKNLEALTLQWSLNYRSNLSRSDRKRQEVVLEDLQPREILKYLRIKGYCGRKLPSWLKSIMLTELVLEDCHCLDCLELPNCLTKLSISRCPTIQNMLLSRRIRLEQCQVDIDGYPYRVS